MPKIFLSKLPPERVISCVPSLTHTLIKCGVGKYIVGRTKFCIHPSQKVKTIPIIGGTKNINIDKVRRLKPDLIIANKEENSKNDIELLSQDFPVYISEISSVRDSLHFLNDMFQIFRVKGFKKIAEKIKSLKGSIKQYNNIPRVAYFIWKDPFMTVGKDTYIHSMITSAGFCNVYENKTRYPDVDFKELQSLNPEFIFLSSEPYPFKEKHIGELNVLGDSVKTILVDGEMFSWYGSKFIKAMDYFATLRNKLRIDIILPGSKKFN